MRHSIVLLSAFSTTSPLIFNHFEHGIGILMHILNLTIKGGFQGILGFGIVILIKQKRLPQNW